MSIRGIFVALVDDDEMLREALAGLLEISGMTVEQYDSGGQFLAAAANSNYGPPPRESGAAARSAWGANRVGPTA